MNNKEFILYSIDFIDTSLPATAKLIDFYIHISKFDESLAQSINNLLDGYSLLIKTFPQVVTGRMDGISVKNELANSLNEVQVALIYAEEYPDKFNLAFKSFLDYWFYFKQIIKNLATNERIIQIFPN